MSIMQMPRAALKLADGSIWPGRLRGGPAPAAGEVVFCTAMGGYPEAITDPSYADQILVMTYPQVGIYGVPSGQLEASHPRIRALIVRDLAGAPPGEQSLEEYLAAFRVPILTEVDTRSLVRHLRTFGTLAGAVLSEGEPAWPTMPMPNPREMVETYPDPDTATDAQAARVTVVNWGSKRSLVRLLRQAGAQVRVVAGQASYEEIVSGADGVVFSNGPGDPADLTDLLPVVRSVAETRPTLGICLGHQLLAQAFGGRTFKLRFGHRGANHPVQDLSTGAIWTTSHNHGYAVEDPLPDDLEPTTRDLTDGTLEGLAHRHLPVLAVQFHPEGAPGPSEALMPIRRFMHLVTEERARQ